jgi:putative endonuclease
MATHNDIGKQGEDIAFNFLKKTGYKILDRNWTWYKGEIDIIAEDGEYLVIVEVKTRSVYYHCETDDLIGKKKLKLLYETADKYVVLKDIDKEVRYDLVIVIFHGETWTVEHITDAFYPFMNT